jgi:hypothetical protein
METTLSIPLCYNLSSKIGWKLHGFKRESNNAATLISAVFNFRSAFNDGENSTSM